MIVVAGCEPVVVIASDEDRVWAPLVVVVVSVLLVTTGKVSVTYTGAEAGGFSVAKVTVVGDGGVDVAVVTIVSDVAVVVDVAVVGEICVVNVCTTGTRTL